MPARRRPAVQAGPATCRSATRFRLFGSAWLNRDRADTLDCRTQCHSPPQTAPQPACGFPRHWSRTARRARPGCVPPPNPPACAACPAARVWYLTQSLDVQTDAVTVTVLKIVCKYQLSFFVVLECRKFAWNSESPGPRALIQAASPVLMRTTGFSPRKI